MKTLYTIYYLIKTEIIVKINNKKKKTYKSNNEKYAPFDIMLTKIERTFLKYFHKKKKNKKIKLSLFVNGKNS